jgi:hypothetical protein
MAAHGTPRVCVSAAAAKMLELALLLCLLAAAGADTTQSSAGRRTSDAASSSFSSDDVSTTNLSPSPPPDASPRTRQPEEGKSPEAPATTIWHSRAARPRSVPPNTVGSHFSISFIFSVGAVSRLFLCDCLKPLELSNSQLKRRGKRGGGKTEGKGREADAKEYVATGRKAMSREAQGRAAKRRGAKGSAKGSKQKLEEGSRK